MEQPQSNMPEIDHSKMDHSKTSMSNRFEKGFDRIKCIEETHTTPFNTQQNFLFCSFQKKQTDAFVEC